MSKTISVDREILVACIKNSTDGHISYELGAKAPSLDCDSNAIDKIDCSGYVRWAVHRITEGIVTMPDGSWNQRVWCQNQDFNVCDYSDCGNKDDILRIAFLDPTVKNGKVVKAGHVWLVVNRSTIESRGGVGPSRRPWNNKTLFNNVDFCFELTKPLS